jgi:hypothetical protein
VVTKLPAADGVISRMSIVVKRLAEYEMPYPSCAISGIVGKSELRADVVGCTAEIVQHFPGGGYELCWIRTKSKVRLTLSFTSTGMPKRPPGAPVSGTRS